MRNYLLLVMFFTTSFFMFSQDNTENEAVTTRRTTSYKSAQVASEPFTRKDYSHWSLTLDAGLNGALTDVSPDFSVLYKEPFKHWTLGGTVEYTINPMFSLGVGYNFNKIGAEETENNVGNYFTSKVHQVYPFMGVNLLNYPMLNRNKRWDLWFTLGIGVMHYNSDLRYAYPENNNFTFNGAPMTEEAWGNVDNKTGAYNTKRWGVVAPATLELSYNITRQFAIGLKYRHDFYNRDDIEGGPKFKDNDKYGRKNYTFGGVSNDQLSSFQLSFRWNITAKDKGHMRTFEWATYENEDLNDIKDRLDNLENRVDDIDDRLQDVETLLSNDGPDDDGDGVPNHRDLEPNTPPNTPVDFWGRTLLIPCDACEDLIPSVYFDFDKTNLDDDALVTIQKVAAKMKENPNMMVEVRGYADYMGSNSYNDKLSQRRADRVKKELVDVWGISANRIVANGKGRVITPEKKYRPNRRCDFFFSN